MILRNKGHSLAGIFIRISSAILSNVTSGSVRGIKSFLRAVNEIARYQGTPGLVKYLKACSIALQQAIAGQITVQVPRVSKTRTGLPRILPAHFRESIRLGRACYIRLSLTLISLYRDLLYPSPPKINSIVDPFKGDQEMVDLVISYIPRFKDNFLTRYTKFFGPDLVEQNRFSFTAIFKSSPLRVGSFLTYHPYTIIRSAIALPEFQIRNIALLTYGIRLEFFESILGPIKWGSPNPYESIIRRVRDFAGHLKLPFKHSFIGKLGFKQEPAGKLRVFAMVDPWTQWALRPFHLGLFSILRRIPMDGTFDQLSPLKKAFEFPHLFSMDLSSATDRLPISIQTPLISSIFEFDRATGQAWEDLLVKREYLVPKTSYGHLPNTVTYSVGQPMGALSSWAMLAMTHHLIVQVAAWESGVTSPNAIFTHYGVLGDDIVIFNAPVAKKYHEIITRLGVECNLAKSVLSPKGLGLEFAKRTFWKDIDVSPIPLKEVYSALQDPTALYNFGEKYSLSLGQMVRVAGFGYKVLGSLSKPWIRQNYRIKFLQLIFVLKSNTEAYAETLTMLRRNLSSSMLLRVLYEFFDHLYKRELTRIGKAQDIVMLRTPLARHNLERALYSNVPKEIPLPLLQSLYNMVLGPIRRRLATLLRSDLIEIERIRYSIESYSAKDLLAGITRFINLLSQIEVMGPSVLELRKTPELSRSGVPSVYRMHARFSAVADSFIKKDLNKTEFLMIEAPKVGQDGKPSVLLVNPDACLMSSFNPIPVIQSGIRILSSSSVSSGGIVRRILSLRSGSRPFNIGHRFWSIRLDPIKFWMFIILEFILTIFLSGAGYILFLIIIAVIYFWITQDWQGTLSILAPVLNVLGIPLPDGADPSWVSILGQTLTYITIKFWFATSILSLYGNIVVNFPIIILSWFGSFLPIHDIPYIGPLYHGFTWSLAVFGFYVADPIFNLYWLFVKGLFGYSIGVELTHNVLLIGIYNSYIIIQDVFLDYVFPYFGYLPQSATFYPGDPGYNIPVDVIESLLIPRQEFIEGSSTSDVKSLVNLPFTNLPDMVKAMAQNGDPRLLPQTQYLPRAFNWAPDWLSFSITERILPVMVYSIMLGGWVFLYNHCPLDLIPGIVA